jgi:hypothetical protein
VPPESGHSKPPTPPGKGGASREVIFEFTPIGGSVKATAIDVATSIEVSVVGPAGPASHRELERIALQKLQHRLERENGDAPAPKSTEPPKGGTGGGIIV